MSQIETVMTFVSFIGHGFLNSWCSNPIEHVREGEDKNFNAFNLIGGRAYATMQPHFHWCVFQNLNFPVFDETENCQFNIFRFLVKK